MGKRLYSANVKKEYPNLGSLKECKKLGGKCLYQKDYGDEYDCTITCLAFIFGEQHYAEIEKIAKKYGYNGNTCGTFQIVIRSIMRDCMKKFGVCGTAKSAYIKNVGFSWQKIKELINSDTYVILNLQNDGRGYYKSHSVTIVGYGEYDGANLLLVYDNWNYGISYIDYDKMGVITSINWIKK